ncbi:hypothetical protein M089_1330 [Bacteroides ovatus str. 3725 D9 iii]|jgi:hypothetical protein|nr:hypothetical protein M082_3134 [Bacteroides fragilis str. 3725 D9 ii]KDS44613.1 hypothetical protein M089_1330 [Bacteroides ovatus str. 3725 D9 iii]
MEENVFSIQEKKRGGERRTVKTDKVKAAGGKKFPACGLYE